MPMMSKKHQSELKTTVGCPVNEIPVLQQTYSNNVQIISLSVLLALIICYFIYIRFFAETVLDTVFMRYKTFFTQAYGNITVTFIIGLLAWSLVSEFVTDIIQPLVQASFPDYGLWYNPVVLKTYNQLSNTGQPETIDVLMKPGSFLIILISFIVSLVIVFIFAEIIYHLSTYPILTNIGKYFAYIIILGLVILFLVWTIIAQNNIVPICQPITSPQPANIQQLANIQQPAITNSQPDLTSAIEFAKTIMATVYPQQTQQTQQPTNFPKLQTDYPTYSPNV